MKRYIVSLFAIMAIGIDGLARKITVRKVVRIAGTVANVD